MTLQAALTILFFITSFLAIFTPLLVYVRKSEEKKVSEGEGDAAA